MNMHGVKFKVVRYKDYVAGGKNFKDYRLQYWQGDILHTDRSFSTKEAAESRQAQLEDFFERNVGNYLFRPHSGSTV